MVELPFTSRRFANAALAGIGLMLAAVIIFVSNNALGKWVLVGLPVGQFLVMRSGMALLLLAPFFWRTGIEGFRAAPRWDLQFLRLVLSGGEIATFYLTVSYLPLADTITFWLATPIYVTALSAILLGEKVGWRRWTAVIVGFCGVLMAMQPSAASFTGPAILGVVGAILYAGVLIITRSLRSTADPVLLCGPLVGSLVVGLFMVPFGWRAPGPSEFTLFLVMASLFLIGSFLSNRSLKLAPASVVVPYQYTMIIWGAIAGFLVFGDIPDILTIIGGAIITCAGIYIFMREQALARREPAPIDPA